MKLHCKLYHRFKHVLWQQYHSSNLQSHRNVFIIRHVVEVLFLQTDSHFHLADTDNAITNFHNGIFFSYFVNFQKCVWDQSSIQKQLYFKKLEQIL